MKQNKREQWIDSEFKFEDIKIGNEYLNWKTKTLSLVTNLTSNTIEMFNKTDQANRYKAGSKDVNGEIQLVGRLRGIDCKNWYTLDSFNRQFKSVL